MIRDEQVIQIKDIIPEEITFTLSEHPRHTLFERLRQQSDPWQADLKRIVKKHGRLWAFSRTLENMSQDNSQDNGTISLTYSAKITKLEPWNKPVYIKKADRK